MQTVSHGFGHITGTGEKALFDIQCHFLARYFLSTYHVQELF